MPLRANIQRRKTEIMEEVRKMKDQLKKAMLDAINDRLSDYLY